MQVILFDNIDRLGMKGEVVNVANGYYRNYLGPRSMALEATPNNLKRLEAKRKQLKTEAEKQRQEAEGFSKHLATAKIHFIRKSPDGEKLFGSVHDHEILEQLIEQGFKIERRQLVLREPIKTTGTHTIKVRLVGNLETTLKVVVEPEEDLEAKEAKAEMEERAKAYAEAEALATGQAPE